jgi:hypothetical protein
MGGAEAKPACPHATSPDDPLPIVPARQRGAPIDVGVGATLTFTVIPEQPAISRAVMTIHVMAVEAGSPCKLGFLRMSAENARTFLTDLRNGRSSIVALGDEDGTVQIMVDVTDDGVAFAVHQTGEPNVLCRGAIDRTFDIKWMADELLGDLGA